MKSTDQQLRDRGMAAAAEIERLSHKPAAELLELLAAREAHIRSAAAINLQKDADWASEKLLLQLSVETCLYTRIAICESLEQGSVTAARNMIRYLGCIGSNQHQVLPQKVSAKKCFPLPRDIVARTLGRMDESVFPVLLSGLAGEYGGSIYELLDAIGYMVYHNPVLGTEINCEQLIKRSSHAVSEERLALWKLIICLSVFPCDRAREFLHRYAADSSILGLEARRSLQMINRK